jgi:hypothetical protein
MKMTFETTYVAGEKMIRRVGTCQVYPMVDEVTNAVTQIDWAASVLIVPPVIYPNGRSSHEVANEVNDMYEDILIDHLCIS